MVKSHKRSQQVVMGCPAAKVRRAYGTKLWPVREPLSDSIMQSMQTMLAISGQKAAIARDVRAESGLAEDVWALALL